MAKAVTLVKNGPSSSAFEITEISDPKPKPEEALILVEAFGLNYADVMARLGLYQDCPPLPCVIGYEIVGKITEINGTTPDFKVGDRVISFTRFGGYASHVCAPFSALAKIPDSLDSATATALGTQYVTAYFSAYEMTKMNAGDHVLIHAAGGGVGTALVQMAKNEGCTVYGTTGSESKTSYLKSIGVDQVIVNREGGFAEELMKASQGKKMNLIYDSIGGKTFRNSVKVLSAGGRIVSYGAAEMTSGKGSKFGMIKTALSFGFFSPIQFLSNSQGLLGVNMLRIADDRPELMTRSLRAVSKLAFDQKIKPVLGRTFPVSEIAQAHDYLESRKSVGKVAVLW